MTIGRTKQPFYIRATDPKFGRFVHHSDYAGLKGIVLEGALRRCKRKPGICLTTDPGRFTSPLPMLAPATMDGFVEFPVGSLVKDGYAIPCLYATHDPFVVERAREAGHVVYPGEAALPPEYRYVRRFVTRRDLFVSENEWFVLDEWLNLPDYKVYVRDNLRKRLVGAVRPAERELILSVREHEAYRGK